MRTILLAAAIAVACAACGSRSTAVDDDTLPDPGAGGDPPDPSASELDARKYAACERAGPRLTECAIEDARQQLSADEFARLDVANTGPAHTRAFLDKCRGDQLSSRQVRVYEVCVAEEAECGALMACLQHLRPEGGE